MSEVLKATFEEVVDRQQQLLSVLKDLETKNIPLPSENFDNAYELLSRSTFGLGYIPKTIQLNGNHYKISNPEKFICMMFECKETTISPFFLNRVEHINLNKPVEIKHVWREIRFLLFDVFPHAKEAAVKMSKERERYVQSSGFSPSQRNKN